jgi:hypothetical protein
VLYFDDVTEPGGGRPGGLAPFKHFLNATTVIDRKELAKVRRLAVHENLFLGRCGGSRGNSAMTFEMHLRTFWEVVREKFKGVVQVSVVVRKEQALIDWDDVECKDQAVEVINDGDWNAKAGRDDQQLDGLDAKDRVPKNEPVWFETPYMRVLRSVKEMQDETGWVAPKWRVWNSDGERIDMHRAGHCMDGKFWCTWEYEKGNGAFEIS